jgi:predicted transcriptional regulator
MATAKQDARKILDGLTEVASLEDIQYHLYVLQRIQRGREDVEAGRIITQDEVEQRLARCVITGGASR